MRHWLFAALFVFLVAYQANGAKITNKKLDEKLDQIIKLLQPSPNPSKNCLHKEIILRSEKQFLA